MYCVNDGKRGVCVCVVLHMCICVRLCVSSLSCAHEGPKLPSGFFPRLLKITFYFIY